MAEAQAEEEYLRDIAEKVATSIVTAGKALSENALGRIMGPGQKASLPEVFTQMKNAGLLVEAGLNRKRKMTYAVPGVTPGFDQPAVVTVPPAAATTPPNIGTVNGERAA